MKKNPAIDGMSFLKPQKKVLGTALLASALLLPAFASSASATVTCPSGSTSVGNGICEVVFTTPGETTWTVPANVTNIEALLVGAGGASDGYYGAGGGDVKIFQLTPSGVISVTVGNGGSGGSDGLPSSIAQSSQNFEAAGGTAGPTNFAGGTSGSGIVADTSSGSGAGAAGGLSSGGAGIVVSSLDSVLFKSVSDCFGGGGAEFDRDGSIATCGGAFLTNFVPNDLDTDGEVITLGSAQISAPIANSGGGAGANVIFADLPPSFLYDNTPQDGADGKVVIRFTLSDQLAKTGGSAMPWLLGGAAAVGAAGAALTAIARRKRA